MRSIVTINAYLKTKVKSIAPLKIKHISIKVDVSRETYDIYLAVIRKFINYIRDYISIIQNNNRLCFT